MTYGLDLGIIGILVEPRCLTAPVSASLIYVSVFVLTCTSRPVQKFDDVLSSGGREFLGFVGGPSDHELLEITACELPLEGPCDPLIVLLEAYDTGGDFIVGGKVGRDECFSLEDREVDLDLVDPAGVLGQVDKDEVVERPFESVDRALASVDCATIDDPEDSASRTIGFLAHDPSDERVEGNDRDLLDDVAKESSSMHVPGSDVGTNSVTSILVLDHGTQARAGLA